MPTWLSGQQGLSQDSLGIGRPKDYQEEDRQEEDGLKDRQEDCLEDDGLKDHQEDRLEEDGLKDHQEDHLEEDGLKNHWEDHHRDQGQPLMAGSLDPWQEDSLPYLKEIETSQKHSWMNGTSTT